YSGYGLDQDDPGNPSDLVRHLLSLDLANGAIQWDLQFPSQGTEKPYQGFQALHGYASSTPVSDGTHVFAFFGRDGVVAATLDGKQVWRTSVGTDTHSWGSAASPVLFQDLVIVNASVESGALVALNKSDGKQAWRFEGIRQAWSSPILVPLADGRTELVVSHRGELIGLDPKSGKKLWNCDFIQDYICPTPVAHDGIVYAIGGRRNQAIAVRAGGQGDVTETHRLWEARAGSNVSSPVYFDGHLYFLNESRGMAYCVDATSGNIVYQERLTPRPGTIYASPVVAGGRIYAVSRENGAFVLAAKPEFELIQHNEPLDESIFNGSPAVSGNRMILRSDQFV
ncbi:MAG: serine/threonine protein kinase, partial [Planctomycetota bacterium]